MLKGMTFLGADTEQLLSASERISDGGQRIEELLTTLGPLVQGVEWTGPDADAFRDRFEEARRRGSDAAQSLSERSSRLKQEAEEQDEASGEDGAGGLPGSGDSPCTPGTESNPGGLPDWVDKVFDHYRGQGIDRMLKDLAHSPWARGLGKVLPGIGALPEVGDLIAHVRAGDVGGGISDIGSIALGFVPGGGILNVADGVSPAFMPGGKSLMDWGGEIESNGIFAQQGKMTGAAISATLGLDPGSTADTVTRSSASIGGYVSGLILPGVNTLTGAWNTFR